MKLSSVYEGGKGWAISYDTGHGDRELGDYIFTRKEFAQAWLNTCKGFFLNPLIVSFKV